MQTQTVQNSPLGNVAAPTRPSFAARDDGQFQQALTRELAARQPEPEAPARPAPRPAAPTKAPTQATPKPAAQQASKPADAEKPATSAGNEPTKAGPSAPSSQNAGANGASAGDKPAEAETAADESANNADATAALLAMMAGYGQTAGTGAAAAATDASTAADAAAAATARAALAASGATDAAAAAPADAGMTEAPAEFAAALAKATSAKDAKPDVPTVEAKTESIADSGLKPLSQQGRTVTGARSDAAPVAQDQPADKLALDSKSDTTALQTQQAKVDAAAPRGELKAQEVKPEITLKAPEPTPQPVAMAAPAALNAAANVQAANAVAGNQLQARVGTQAWDQQLGQKVVWMVAGGDQSATLTLNPPDLGPLQVVLNVSNDQASVAFTAAQPEVRQALENAMPKLKEMMSEAGIQLGQTNVSAGDPGQQQSAFAEAASGRSSGGGGRGHGAGFGNGSDNGGNASPPAPTPRRSILGAVDTFA